MNHGEVFEDRSGAASGARGNVAPILFSARV